MTLSKCGFRIETKLAEEVASRERHVPWGIVLTQLGPNRDRCCVLNTIEERERVPHHRRAHVEVVVGEGAERQAVLVAWAQVGVAGRCESTPGEISIH